MLIQLQFLLKSHFIKKKINDALIKTKILYMPSLMEGFSFQSIIYIFKVLLIINQSNEKDTTTHFFNFCYKLQ
jgi:hypothetical protein